MTPTPTAPVSGYTPASQSWFARAEGWLDERGKGAWIAAMVIGFVVFWPVGLALLAYMIWSRRMENGSCMARRRSRSMGGRGMTRSSGNAAFDQYRADTLRRLEEEQHAFEEFLRRLREAKDKSEFDQFLEERAQRSDGGDETPTQPAS